MTPTDAAVDNDRRALLDRYGAVLLGIAYAAIDHGLQGNRRPPTETQAHPEPLCRQGASFVTLRAQQNLRGCVGSPRAVRGLAADVAANAFAAAFHDSRFAPLRPDERPSLAVSISLLSPPEPVAFTGEDDLLRQLRPGEDGLIIEHCGSRALFLPQVWASLPQPDAFLAQLKHKAGIAADETAGLVAWRFSVDVVSSSDCTP